MNTVEVWYVNPSARQIRNILLKGLEQNTKHQNEKKVGTSYYCNVSVVVLPSVWKGTLWAILLDMHAKETNVHTIYFLKCKKCFGSVREALHHFTRIHKPVETHTHTQSYRLFLHSSITWKLLFCKCLEMFSVSRLGWIPHSIDSLANSQYI